MIDHLRKRWRKRIGRSSTKRTAYFDDDDFDAIGGGYPSEQAEAPSDGRKKR